MTHADWLLWWSGFWSGAGCLGAVELVICVFVVWRISKFPRG